MTDEHLLDSAWHLEEDEVHRWILDLRSLRLEQRLLIESFMTLNATKDELAIMRNRVCEKVVDGLVPLLTKYWSNRLTTADTDFFFSPGYRPYGLDRAALVLESSVSEQVKNEEKELGRHSDLSQNKVFGLGSWMKAIYSQQIGMCKIGGFTDWFKDFDSIRTQKIFGSSVSPNLVALAISCSTDEHEIRSGTANGVSRFHLPQQNSELVSWLRTFEKALLEEFKKFEISPSSSHLIPYPPAFVFRDGKPVEVDLSGDFPKLAKTGAAIIDKDEILELNKAKARFACLFASIFLTEYELPQIIDSEEDKSYAIRSRLQHNSSCTAYEYYHVFVTDQNVSFRQGRGLQKEVIGSQLGTLNLYTHHPICDVGIGLIRDTLESIYSMVRDAEIRMHSTVFKFFPNDIAADNILSLYLSPWEKIVKISSKHYCWHHEHFGAKYTPAYIPDIALGISPALRLPNGTIDEHLAKTLFQTNHRNCKSLPDNARYLTKESAARILPPIITSLFPTCPVTFEVSQENSFWYPPFLPSILFFLGVRALLVNEANGTDKKPIPASIILKCSKSISILEINLNVISGSNIEARIASKQNDINPDKLYDGLCGRAQYITEGRLGLIHGKPPDENSLLSYRESLSTAVDLSNPIHMIEKAFAGIHLNIKNGSLIFSWNNPER